MSALEAHQAWTQSGSGSDKERQETFNIYDTLLHSSLPADEKQPHRLHHEAFQTLGAGTLTTAKVATMATYFVLADDRLQRDLQDELHRTFGDRSSDMSVAELEKCSLLVR